MWKSASINCCVFKGRAMFSKLKKLFKSGQLPPQEATRATVKAERDLPKNPSGPSPENSGILPEKTTVSQPAPLLEIKVNRKGIRVFEPGQDVESLLQGDDIPSEEPRTLRPEKQIKPRPKVKKRETRFTKHGFPILDRMDDFSCFMENNKEEVREDEGMKGTELQRKAPLQAEARNRDKHGIPILSAEDSQAMDRMFMENGGDDFSRLLNESLGQKSREVMLDEKGTRNVRRKPLTFKQKISRYPLPQSQLDLHGYTSIKAELRAETYLKNAFNSHIHTLIIIVGKGLHSEEGAVLPDVVENLLIRLRKAHIVFYYEWERQKKSQSGSVIVYLNNLEF